VTLAGQLFDSTKTWAFSIASVRLKEPSCSRSADVIRCWVSTMLISGTAIDIMIIITSRAVTSADPRSESRRARRVVMGPPR
jgi:hypothetical protein